jgi:trafficking protein particle complex subunit 13
MQTVSTKVQLAEFGGRDHTLAAGDTLENVVQHEIKELGQHVLACTVTYRLPPNARHVPGPAEDVSDPALQTFRKFYKFAVSNLFQLRKILKPSTFQVTNPLSVKTKVHVPRSPTALLSSAEREKIFLEVHIQNLTPEPMWFERMSLEAVDGWTIVDENAIGTGPVKESVFSESSALMQPQDMRQYVYTMTPVLTPTLPVIHAPGSIIPLGRLDISWRSSFGEPGRLLTSVCLCCTFLVLVPFLTCAPQMLSRRIPLPPPVQAASAVPPYLQRNTMVPSGVPPRPGSPQHVPSRPGTPPIRPGSPFRSRNGTPSISTRPQSPGPTAASTSHHSAAASHVALNVVVRPPDLEVDLVVSHIPRDLISIEKPFTIACKLNVSAAVPYPQSHGKQRHRIITLVVQHVQHRRVSVAPVPEPAPVLAAHPDASNPRLPSALTSASPTSIPWRGAFGYDKPLVLSPDQHSTNGGEADRHSGEMIRNADGIPHGVVLPSPFTDKEEDKRPVNSSAVVFLGPSAIFLDPIRLSGSTTDEQVDTDDGGNTTIRIEAAQEFDLSYLPLVKGFSSIGGLRIILVEDRLDDDDRPTSDVATDARRLADVRILKDWDVIGEIWVKT